MYLAQIGGAKSLACDHARSICGSHFCESGECSEGAGSARGYPQPRQRRATGDHLKHTLSPKLARRMHAHDPASVHSAWAGILLSRISVVNPKRAVQWNRGDLWNHTSQQLMIISEQARRIRWSDRGM